MTRKERATVQGFINKLSELDKIEHETLETLKGMCETYGDGNRWCSWRACLDKIAEASGIESLEYRRAEGVYERFIKASAQRDLIMKFGSELAEIGFWKN